MSKRKELTEAELEAMIAEQLENAPDWYEKSAKLQDTLGGGKKCDDPEIVKRQRKTAAVNRYVKKKQGNKKGRR